MVGDPGDPALRSQVLLELRPGENLLWVGKPNPTRVVMQHGDEVAGAVFGMIFTIVILVVFPLLARSINVPSMQTFLSVMEGVVVLALIFSVLLPIYRYITAQGIIYGLTDRRALIIRPTLSSKAVTSYNKFDQLERHERADGSGDLTFGYEPYTRRVRPGRSRKIGFFGVANVRQVERLMLETFSKPLKTSDER